MQRDRRGWAGEALFRPIMQDIHPGFAIGTGDADTSFRSPMAIAVIGGLMTSTFLSLLVIPVVYTLMDDFEHGLKRLFLNMKKLGVRKA